MGYSKEMVEQAVKIFMSKNGNCDFKGTDLFEILFDIEENPEKQEKSTNDGDESSEYIEHDKKEVADADQLESLETLLEENHRLKENQMCKICLDSRADVIFLPCGHMVSCPQCAQALLKCPVCRQTVNGQLKAFFPVVRTTT
ncbi:baculoviral IAP repeat-containing protein 7-A-like [Mercenaria mercenaria]|uniref:baculoviral IAP repeat-containing protein 7-A-like n=1 Tax=Mercenaria mercenaria TaxID=6596 RepID=UPI00234ECC5A|nr:baculoviral IAP repeat-containing protein 7-A-like [Mercenaria mercenaria]